MEGDRHLHSASGATEEEIAGYSGLEQTALGMEDMRKLIEEQVTKKTLEIRLNPTCEAIDGRSKQRSGSVNQTQTTDKESSLPMAFPAESSTFF